MLLDPGRVLNSTGVLEKQPPKPCIIVFNKTIVMKSGHRQAGKDFLVRRPFDQRTTGPNPALFRDDGAAIGPDSKKPIDFRPSLLFQDLDAVGHDALWAQGAPGFDGSMLPEVRRDEPGCRPFRHRFWPLP